MNILTAFIQLILSIGLATGAVIAAVVIMYLIMIMDSELSRRGL